MENGPFIDGLPIENGGSFHGYVSHNQMVKEIHRSHIFGAQNVESFRRNPFGPKRWRCWILIRLILSTSGFCTDISTAQIHQQIQQSSVATEQPPAISSMIFPATKTSIDRGVSIATFDCSSVLMDMCICILYIYTYTHFYVCMYVCAYIHDMYRYVYDVNIHICYIYIYEVGISYVVRSYNVYITGQSQWTKPLQDLVLFSVALDLVNSDFRSMVQDITHQRNDG